MIGFWIATALFCLQMGFTAYAQLQLLQVAEVFTHLGFPPYFPVELSWALRFPRKLRVINHSCARGIAQTPHVLTDHLVGPASWGVRC